VNLTYAELFAGAGGMSIGLEAAGWRCVAHAEIEPHARAVLRKQWPEVPLYGDVTQLNGADFKGITLLTGGSPCQDLSIAGKRAGMVEGSGTRSSLFFEQVRIWKESQAPLILWENVYGAFSSNNGRDFAAVLSAIVGAAVAVPADGWRNAGVASGPAGIAAWRTLDAQHFGWDGDTTPQRRRRVFVLGTQTGAVDPAEVLLVSNGLLGHLAASGEAREGTAEDAVASVDRESGCLTPWDNQSKRVFSANGVFPTLGAAENSGQQQQSVLTYEWHGADTRFKDTDKSPTLNTRQDNGQGQVLVLNEAAPVYPIDLRNATRTTDKDEQNCQGSGIGEDGDPSPTLTGLFTPAVLTYDTAVPIQNPEMKDKGQNGTGIGNPNDPMFTLESRGHGVVTYDTRGNGDGRIVNTLAGDHQNRVTDYTAVILRNREGKPGGGKGPLLSEGQRLTLGTTNDQVVFTKTQYGAYEDQPSVDATLGARDHASLNVDIAVGVGIPRRLMPVECERLMGWPDQWTAIGVNEKGVEYALSDTARYKLCGNGIASPVTAWIGLRLREVLDSPRPAL
jgi:DNA-cytosine methyltransferase